MRLNHINFIKLEGIVFQGNKVFEITATGASIVERAWRVCKVRIKRLHASIKPSITILKWRLSIKIPSRNFVHCVSWKWSSGGIFVYGCTAQSNVCTRQSPWVETVPELQQERSHGESEGANSAGDFLFDAGFAHAACHCFNSGTWPCNSTLIVFGFLHAYNINFEKAFRTAETSNDFSP